MRDEIDRDLAILSAIAQNERLTQRHLAQELGVAVSLANLYLRQLVFKGFIRIIKVQPNRLRYLLTPKGIGEKARLTYAYMCRSFERYRETRESIREVLRPLTGDGLKRIAFYGVGDAAEVVYVCLKETGLDLSSVFDNIGGRSFLGQPVRCLEELFPHEFDQIIITSFENLEATKARVEQLLRRGAARDQIMTLHR